MQVEHPPFEGLWFQLLKLKCDIPLPNLAFISLGGASWTRFESLWFQLLKLKYDTPLSNLAYECDVCPSTQGAMYLGPREDKFTPASRAIDR